MYTWGPNQDVDLPFDDTPKDEVVTADFDRFRECPYCGRLMVRVFGNIQKTTRPHMVPWYWYCGCGAADRVCTRCSTKYTGEETCPHCRSTNTTTRPSGRVVGATVKQEDGIVWRYWHVVNRFWKPHRTG